MQRLIKVQYRGAEVGGLRFVGGFGIPWALSESVHRIDLIIKLQLVPVQFALYHTDLCTEIECSKKSLP